MLPKPYTEPLKPFSTQTLDRETTGRHETCLAALLSTIPCVTWTPSDVVADQKKGVPLNGKWERSLIVFDGRKPVAVLLAYDRPTENNDQYPCDSLYIAGLAVDPDYRRRGIGKALLDLFLKKESARLHHAGLKPVFSVQTNNAPFNTHVVALYKSCGFIPHGFKPYDNRTDLILYRDK